MTEWTRELDGRLRDVVMQAGGPARLDWTCEALGRLFPGFAGLELQRRFEAEGGSGV
jgi:hypothetical protein